MSSGSGSNSSKDITIRNQYLLEPSLKSRGNMLPRVHQIHQSISDQFKVSQDCLNVEWLMARKRLRHFRALRENDSLNPKLIIRDEPVHFHPNQFLELYAGPLFF